MLKLTSPTNRFVVIGILVVLLSFPMVNYAQDTNDRYLDGELLQRATRLALEEYKRAVEYGLSAERIQPPSSRAAEYERMLRSFNDALQLYNVIENKPDAYHNIPKILARFWATEYNAGVNIINDDSVRQTLQNPFESAMAHLENAILIQPDSAIAYAALSSVHLHMQDTSAAIAWYEEALELKKDIKKGDYDVLIDLYFAENRLEDAVALSLKAREDYPEETGFIRVLADVYLGLGETEKAVSVIRELTEIETDNARYHNIIASLVYQIADIHLEEAREMYSRAEELKSEVQQLSGFERRRITERISELETAAEEKEREGERLIDVAIEDYKKVLEIEPQNEEVLIMLGIIYQNKAVELFENHDNAENRMQAIEYDENARMTLATSMDYYERAAELDPDNMDYWEVLYHIYLELGMGVKLENTMDKLGI